MPLPPPDSQDTRVGFILDLIACTYILIIKIKLTEHLIKGPKSESVVSVMLRTLIKCLLDYNKLLNKKFNILQLLFNI